MATRGLVYAAPADDIGTWGTPTRTTLSGTTESYGSSVDANGYLGVVRQIGILFDTSPTDDVIVSVYAALSDSFDAQDLPVQQIRVEAVSNDEVFLYIVTRDVEFSRVGVVQTGATDSHDVRVRSSLFRDTDN